MIKTQTSNQRIEEYIATLVQAKKVLDLGCVDHSARQELQAGWLHRRLAQNAASIVGMDILEEEVRQLQAKGYRMVCGDAMTANLSDEFDVIVAGELIEHVDNPGQFVSNMRRHLKSDDLLVVTTPNPFYLLHFVEFMFASPDQRWNPEHVAWFCSFTLRNLLQRNGMQLERCIYFARSRKIRKLMVFLHLRCPRILASTMLVVTKPARRTDIPINAG